jgi:alcohol dehydrogenase class IV
MRFEFATATRILFGPGTVREVGHAAKELGRRALIVTGKNPARSRALKELLGRQDIAPWTLSIPGEPTLDDVERGVALARSEGIDLVVGFGGGSAIDAGKAIAALLTNSGDLIDYLEVIGQAKPLTQPPVPFIAIPTTAGTGAEVTRNAVLASPEHRLKVSLRSPLLLPKLAIVDPELTYDLPPALTASTGLDALTQLIEPFVSLRANPLTDGICREGMARAARSLQCAYEHGTDATAREDMALAGLFGGLALANAALGAVHGFAAAIGGMFPAPHGAVCAALLPHVMEVNLRALQKRQPASETLRRYDEVAQVLTGSETADAGVAWVRELCAALKIPGLGAYGFTANDGPALCKKAAVASSMRGNPIALTNEEMGEILERAM